MWKKGNFLQILLSAALKVYVNNIFEDKHNSNVSTMKTQHELC